MPYHREATDSVLGASTPLLQPVLRGHNRRLKSSKSLKQSGERTMMYPSQIDVRQDKANKPQKAMGAVM